MQKIGIKDMATASTSMKSIHRRFRSASTFHSSLNVCSSYRNMSITTSKLVSFDDDSDQSKGSTLLHSLKVGPMKRLYKYYTKTSINLAGGVPMEKCFPIDTISVNTVGIDGTATTTSNATCDTVSTATTSSGSSHDNNFTLKKGGGLSLNYLRGDGIPDLKDWINAHTLQLHKNITSDTVGFTCISCMTVGSTDAFAKTLMLLKGDSVLFDEYAYGTAISTCKVLDKTPIGVAMDEEGLIPIVLKEQIIKARKEGLTPSAVYVIPTAQNPTGITMSLNRKKEIYKVCQELDIFIIEDDAYYYLHYGDDQSTPGMQHLPQSFLSLDTDGRVIRLDSLSKFIAPGLRLGWVSGHIDFITKYQLLQEMTTQFPSSISQSIFLGILKQWEGAGGNNTGNGLDTHLKQLQLHYRKQRDYMCDAIKKYMKPGEYSFVIPSGGMFLWLQLHLKNAPSEMLFRHLAEEGVITVPSKDFHVDSLDKQAAYVDQPIIRLTFAAGKT